MEKDEPLMIDNISDWLKRDDCLVLHTSDNCNSIGYYDIKHIYHQCSSTDEERKEFCDRVIYINISKHSQSSIKRKLPQLGYHICRCPLSHKIYNSTKVDLPYVYYL